MNRISPMFMGLCFLFSACAVNTADDTSSPPLPTAGASGSGPISAGGDGPTVRGGSASGGATTSAGSNGIAGASALGGNGNSGGTSTGGSTGSSGSTSIGGTGGTPPTNIDYSIWELQLPTGSGNSPDTVGPKQVSGVMNPYFFVAKDGGRVFMDPQQGITTNGSTHPRSELRESKPDGSEANWSSSGTNTMTVTGKGLLLSGGSKGSVTVAQVFVAGANPLAELQYTGSAMKLFYEESKGTGAPPIYVDTSVPINTPYQFVISFTNGVLTVNINGKQVYTKTPSSAVSGSKFYFKVGNYDQTATPGTPTPTPYTEIEVYSVSVVHQ